MKKIEEIRNLALNGQDLTNALKSLELMMKYGVAKQAPDDKSDEFDTFLKEIEKNPIKQETVNSKSLNINS